jgi:hypothetical protein
VKRSVTLQYETVGVNSFIEYNSNDGDLRNILGEPILNARAYIAGISSYMIASFYEIMPQ